MTEAIEPKVQIGVENWMEFLPAFAERNYNRRARFDVFRSNGKVEEENLEARLEDVRLLVNNRDRDIVIIRIDRSRKNADKIRDTITNIRGVAVQYDTDGSEDALEITDDQNSLIILRMESKVDGAS